MHIEFQHGSAVIMACWESAYSHYTIEILCKSGRLRYEQGGHKVIWQGISEDKQLKNYRRIDENYQLLQTNMRKYQYEVTCDLAQEVGTSNGNNILCTGEEATSTLYDIHRIIEEILMMGQQLAMLGGDKVIDWEFRRYKSIGEKNFQASK